MVPFSTPVYEFLPSLCLRSFNHLPYPSLLSPRLIRVLHFTLFSFFSHLLHLFPSLHLLLLFLNSLPLHPQHTSLLPPPPQHPGLRSLLSTLSRPFFFQTLSRSPFPLHLCSSQILLHHKLQEPLHKLLFSSLTHPPPIHPPLPRRLFPSPPPLPLSSSLTHLSCLLSQLVTPHSTPPSLHKEVLRIPPPLPLTPLPHRRQPHSSLPRLILDKE